MSRTAADLARDPSLKRAVCVECGTVLIPGLTSRIRNRRKISAVEHRYAGGLTRVADQNHGHRTHAHCSHCAAKRSLPNPPLPHPGDSELRAPQRPLSKLDGPVRQRRRARQARRAKVPFHEREAVTPVEGAASGSKVEYNKRSGGHTLWRGSAKVSGWGTGVATES